MPRPPAPDPIAVAFGAAVRRRRDARDETLETVAGRIPATTKNGQPTTMDPKYLSELEHGWFAPSMTTAKRIADALETPLRDLVEDL
jgi:transcriptional regulator with XRE-family HTH domain